MHGSYTNMVSVYRRGRFTGIFLPHWYITVLSAVIIQSISVPWQSAVWLTILMKGILCVIITNGIYLLVYGRSEEFCYLVEKIRQILAKKRIAHR